MKNNDQEFFKINMIDTKPQIQETQGKKKKIHMQILFKSLKTKHKEKTFQTQDEEKVHYMQRKQDLIMDVSSETMQAKDNGVLSLKY